MEFKTHSGFKGQPCTNSFRASAFLHVTSWTCKVFVVHNMQSTGPACTYDIATQRKSIGLKLVGIGS